MLRVQALLAVAIAVGCQPVVDVPVDGRAILVPRSTSDIPRGSGAEVEIRMDGVRIGGVEAVELREGRPVDGAFVSRTSPPLSAALARQARVHAPPAEPDGLRDVPTPRLHVLADARAHQAALAGVLYTAAKSGFFDFELVVDGADGANAVPLAVPRSWLPPLPDGTHVCVGASITIELGVDTARGFTEGAPPIEIPARADCGPADHGCLDLAGLAAWTASIKAAYPHETAVSVRVDDEVTIQGLVSAIDVLRGRECRLRGALLGGEAVPEACRLWQVVVDTLPPHVEP